MVVSRKQTEINILTQLEVRVQLVRTGSPDQMGPEDQTQAGKLGSSVILTVPSPRPAYHFCHFLLLDHPCPDASGLLLGLIVHSEILNSYYRRLHEFALIKCFKTGNQY